MKPSPIRTVRPVLGARARWHGLLAGLALVSVSGCGGGLGHRSVQQLQGEIAVGPEIRRIRIEVENCTLDIAPPADAAGARKVVYQGGVRRAANTAEGLAAIERVPVTLEVAPDSEPGLLTIRGPRVPAGVAGVIGFEAGIRVPADVPLEVVVSANGHVTMVERAAPSKVDTGRGDLRFERCSGGVEARTGQGVLIAFGHRGDLDVRSAGGDMQAFVEQPGKKLTLETGKGTVQCHVPAELDFVVDARAQTGRIGNDFGLPVETVGEYGAAMVGRRGTGATTIILRTVSGHLSLIKKKFD